METLSFFILLSITNGSYRTYEEWKPGTKTSSSQPCLVLTVPMRNGNKEVKNLSVADMEGSYRTYEEWKPSVLSMLRLKAFGSYRTYEEWKPSMALRQATQGRVLTVPMRNGNE